METGWEYSQDMVSPHFHGHEVGKLSKRSLLRFHGDCVGTFSKFHNSSCFHGDEALPKRFFQSYFHGNRVWAFSKSFTYKSLISITYLTSIWHVDVLTFMCSSLCGAMWHVFPSRGYEVFYSILFFFCSEKYRWNRKRLYSNSMFLWPSLIKQLQAFKIQRSLKK